MSRFFFFPDEDSILLFPNYREAFPSPHNIKTYITRTNCALAQERSREIKTNNLTNRKTSIVLVIQEYKFHLYQEDC